MLRRGLERLILFWLALIILFGSCNHSYERENNSGHEIQDLSIKSTEAVRINLSDRLQQFTTTILSQDTLYFSAINAQTSELFRIKILQDSLEAEPVCMLPFYERFNSTWTLNCSLLKLDNQTGRFTLFSDSTLLNSWKFEKYTPQSLPNLQMVIHEDWVYTSNSSAVHNVSTYEGAKSYFNEVKPLLRFKLDSPKKTVTSLGEFPKEYQTSGENILDFHPSFCTGENNQCAISFAYCDSILIVENDGAISWHLCSSSNYAVPTFPSFEEGKKLSVSRKFQSESNKFTSIHYNQLRREYYRFLKHDSTFDEEFSFSIIVMNLNFEVTREYTFDTSLYSPYPLISTEKGFMLPSMKLSSQNKVLYFERFSL